MRLRLLKFALVLAMGTFLIGEVSAQEEKQEQREAAQQTDDGKLKEVAPGVYTLGKRNKFAEVGTVNSMAVRPDGKHIAFCSGPIMIWDVQEEKIVKKMEATSFSGVQYSLDGETLYATTSGHHMGVPQVDEDGNTTRTRAPLLKYWDADTFEELGELTRPEESDESDDEADKKPQRLAHIAHFALSPDGKYLAITDQNNIELFDVEASERLHFLDRNGYVPKMCFSGDSKTLLFSGQKFKAFDVETGEEKKNTKLKIQAYSSLSINDDVLVAASWQGVNVYKNSDQSMIELEAPEETQFQHATLSSDGKLLAAFQRNVNYGPRNNKKRRSTGGGLIVWDLSNGKIVKRMGGLTTQVRSIAFAADSESIYSYAYSGVGIQEHSLKGDPNAQQEAFSAPSKAIAFKGEGQFITGTAAGRLWFVDMASGETVRASSDANTSDISVSPDGKLISAVNSNQWKISIIGAKSGKQNRELTFTGTAAKSGMVQGFRRMMGTDDPDNRGYRGPPMPCACKFSEDGQYIYGLADRYGAGYEFAKWNAKSGKKESKSSWKYVKDGSRESQEVAPLWQNRLNAISNNGQYFTVALRRGVLLVDSATGEVLHELDSKGSPGKQLFAKDDSWVAVPSTSKPSMTIYDTNSGEVVEELEFEVAGSRKLSLSADGKTLMVAQLRSNNRVLLISTETWDTILEKESEIGRSSTAAISPNGKKVVLGLRDSRYEIWDLDKLEK